MASKFYGDKTNEKLQRKGYLLSVKNWQILMISYELELKMIESSEYIQDPCKSIKVLSRQCSLLTLQRKEKKKSKLVLKKQFI